MWKKQFISRFPEIIRYAIVGGITTFFNLMLFYLFTYTSMNYIVSNVVSYWCAVLVSYYLNEKYVFQNQKQHKSSFIKVVKYFLVRVGSIALDSGLLYVCVSILNYNMMVSKVIVSIIVIILIYVFNRNFVFKMSDKGKQ